MAAYVPKQCQRQLSLEDYGNFSQKQRTVHISVHQDSNILLDWTETKDPHLTSLVLIALVT